MIRKTWRIAILLLVAMLFFSTNVKADSKTTLYIEDTVKYQDSDEVTIKIYMKNISTKICTLTFDVNYDSSKLEFVSSKAGSDIDAIFKLAEDVEGEDRVAVGIVSFSGFDKSGLYYSLTFNVLDASSDIPLSLSVREATDADGNDIAITTKDGTIDVGSKEEKPEEEVSPTGQKIESFEVTEVNELESLEELITDSGNIEVAEADNLVYEVEDSGIVQILEDGTIIPVSDGTTNVRVKLNGETVGNVEIEVQDGKVTKITATDDELEFEATEVVGKQTNSSSSSNTDSSNETNIEGSSTNGTSSDSSNSSTSVNSSGSSSKSIVKIVIIVIIIILILSLMFIKIKNKKRGGIKK